MGAAGIKRVATSSRLRAMGRAMGVAMLAMPAMVSAVVLGPAFQHTAAAGSPRPQGEAGSSITITKVLNTTDDLPSGTFDFTITELQPVDADMALEGVTLPVDLDVTATQTTPGSETLYGVDPGIYRITENLANPLVPFRFVSVTCSGAEFSANAAGRYVDVFVAVDANPVCTFTNESFNLKMAKTDGDATITAGSSFDYTLTVTKEGAGLAKVDASVTDTLPGGLTWVGTPSGTGSTCVVTNSSTTLTCTVTAAQLNTGSAQIVGQVLAPASMSGATLTNTATVDSPEDPADGTGPYALDNTASDSAPLEGFGSGLPDAGGGGSGRTMALGLLVLGSLLVAIARRRRSAVV